MLPFFTIGHSNRSLEKFAELFREPRVERIVDVKTSVKDKLHTFVIVIIHFRSTLQDIVYKE